MNDLLHTQTTQEYPEELTSLKN